MIYVSGLCSGFIFCLSLSPKPCIQAICYSYCFFLCHSKTISLHFTRFSSLPHFPLLLPPPSWQLLWKQYCPFLVHHDHYKHKKNNKYKKYCYSKNTILPSWPLQVTPLILPSTTSNTSFLSSPWDTIPVMSSHLEKATITPSSRASSITWISISPTSLHLPSPTSPLTVGKISFRIHGSNFHSPTSKLTFPTNYPEETTWARMVMQGAGTSTRTRGKEGSHCPSSCFFFVLHITYTWRLRLWFSMHNTAQWNLCHDWLR